MVHRKNKDIHICLYMYLATLRASSDSDAAAVGQYVMAPLREF